MTKFAMHRLENSEQKNILPLLGQCFPDYWEQIAAAKGEMPFEEISFAAFDDSKVVGHCGIIPYDIWCNGEIRKMAGIASVATHPDYRKQGIAADLCMMAAQWAQENGFTSLPLYTAFFRVYESCGWTKLDIPPVLQIVSGKRTAAISWSKGCDLTEAEKNNIISLYENGPDFNGKVRRKNSGTLHSWERIFNEPDFRFAAVPKMYAVKIDDVIVELNFDRNSAELSDKKRLFYQLGAKNIYLPQTSELAEVLEGVELSADPGADAMHGERPLIKDIVPEFHRYNQIFFPVTDKF